MKLNEKKEITMMSEFTNLFLSIYASKVLDEEGKVCFSVEFKDIIENIMNSQYNGEDNYNIYDENGLFKIDEFMKCLSYSSIKEAWAEEFRYDYKNDKITTKVDMSKVKKCIDSNSTHNQSIVKENVDAFIRMQKEYEYSKSENKESKTKKLVV